MSVEFQVFTLNCWGLAVVARNRKARIQAIAEVLATSQYDVVCLQEVWLNIDFNLIKDKAAGAFPYSHYFYSGVTGSGVCILSKHTIEEAFFHQWPVNGYIHKLHHADWFGGKGVGLCRLNVNGFKINVYSAHLHAEYDRDCDEYQAHRVLQAFDTAQFLQLTSGGADLVVLAGDLNTEPGDLACRLMLGVPGLIDAYIEAKLKNQECFATNESLINSYTSSSLIRKNIPGKRIDYIMYHPGSNVVVDLKKYCLPLPNRIPNCSYSYSDHEAVAATFVITKSEFGPQCHKNKSVAVALEESISICNTALKSLVKHKIVYCLFSVIFLALLIVTLVMQSPFGYPAIYHIFTIILTSLFLYTGLMATIWNKIEMHAVLAGKLAMEVSLRNNQAKEAL